MLVVVADQLVKQWVLASFAVNVPTPILGDYVRITLIHNSGGLFGLFQHQAVLFAAVSLVVMGLMVWYHGRAAAGNLLLTITLGLLLGGAVGNFLDRVRFGYVLDFVDAGLGAWRWYTFNVADSAISLAIVLLLLLALRPTGEAPTQRTAGDRGQAAAPPADARPTADGGRAG